MGNQQARPVRKDKGKGKGMGMDRDMTWSRIPCKDEVGD
jgi:hypothetical protein